MFKKLAGLVLAMVFLLSYHPHAASANTYKYDVLHRVVEVTLNSGLVIQYQYDQAGNLLSVKYVRPTA